MTVYLADASVWGWAASGRRPDIAEKLATRIERDELATCAPVALEALHRARTGADYESLFATYFAPLHWLDLDARAAGRALEVQRALAAGTHGNRLRPAIDYLIAATAEQAGAAVTLWFLDRDLRVICDYTGQPYEAERGTSS